MVGLPARWPLTELGELAVSLREDLHVDIGAISILRDVSLALQPGEVTAVLGPNGAGKTSLLRLLCGERAPDQGVVELAGMDVRRWQPRERASVLAVLPQHSVLNFPFSVREVVLLGRTPHGTGLKRDGSIVDQALALRLLLGREV